MKDVVLFSMLIMLIVLIVVIGPLLTIWSLNALFGLGIAYSIKNWFATFILASIVSGGVTKIS